jgi:hypothetical protein
MSQTVLNPSPDVPVNAIWLLCRDQSGRVADTRKGTFVSRWAVPPETGTTNNSQCLPASVVRLKTTVLPSGEKQGQPSLALGSEVTNRTCLDSVRAERLAKSGGVPRLESISILDPSPPIMCAWELGFFMASASRSRLL